MDIVRKNYPELPAQSAPHYQSVRVGNMLFLSGGNGPGHGGGVRRYGGPNMLKAYSVEWTFTVLKKPIDENSGYSPEWHFWTLWLAESTT